MRTSSCPLFHLPAKLSFCIFYPPNSSSIRIALPPFNSMKWRIHWRNFFHFYLKHVAEHFRSIYRSSICCIIPYCFHQAIWQIPGGKRKYPHWPQNLDHASRLHHFTRYLPWKTECKRSFDIVTSIPNTLALMPIRFWVLQPLKTFFASLLEWRSIWRSKQSKVLSILAQAMEYNTETPLPVHCILKWDVKIEFRHPVMFPSEFMSTDWTITNAIVVSFIKGKTPGRKQILFTHIIFPLDVGEIKPWSLSAIFWTRSSVRAIAQYHFIIQLDCVQVHFYLLSPTVCHKPTGRDNRYFGWAQTCSLCNRIPPATFFSVRDRMKCGWWREYLSTLVCWDL